MSSDQNADLDSLVVRLAEGDRSAFTAVFQVLRPPLLRLRGVLVRPLSRRLG